MAATFLSHEPPSNPALPGLSCLLLLETQLSPKSATCSRALNMPLNEHDVREMELLQQLSQSDSISEELQYHAAASSFEDLEPQMASTPVKGGRNVSMTKMLMSSGQFDSALELLTNDPRDETERLHEDSSVENEKLMSQYTPVRESLHNTRQEAEKESIYSSVEIIEKYSGPGALTDFVNPYKIGVRSSTESKDLDQNDSSKNVSHDKSTAVNSEVSMSGVTSQECTGDDPETGNRDGFVFPNTALEKLQKESDDSIPLQRQGSKLKLKTLSSTDVTNIKDTESSDKAQAAMAIVSDVPSPVTPKESGNTGRTAAVQTSKLSSTMQSTDESSSSKCPVDPALTEMIESPALTDTSKRRPSVGSHSVGYIPIVHYPNRCPRRMQSENYSSFDHSRRETVEKTQPVQENKTGVDDNEIQGQISKRTNVSPEVEKLKKVKLLEVKMDSTERKPGKTDVTNPKTFLEGETQDVRSGSYTSDKVVNNNLSDIELGANIGAQANKNMASTRFVKIPPTGAAIGLRPSLGEYKSPEMILREKQRKLTEKMLFANEGPSSKPPVIISYWKKGDKVVSPLAKPGSSENHKCNERGFTHNASPGNSSHSSRSDISGVDVHPEQSGSYDPEGKLQMLESLVSHYSGEKYDTPLARLQRHVDRMRNTSQESFKQEEKRFKHDSTTSKYAADESARSNANIILDETRDTDGITQKHLEKDFEISRQIFNNRDECKGSSERSDSQGEITQRNISLPKKYNPIKYPIDKDEKKLEQTDSAASTPEYTTPSKLLQKYQEREGVREKSPGYDKAI
ncbi:uncharacterized protein LOC124290988 [Haliotis rubra]|uniref:uncharacterized protein LOC124290988 n=1 Tax=Haliotis rubra TaxID=36100 RepID=UPI001EE577D5|nr:uncharacterized protein LOC124290988 [Haliotis rubra]